VLKMLRMGRGERSAMGWASGIQVRGVQDGSIMKEVMIRFRPISANEWNKLLGASKGTTIVTAPGTALTAMVLDGRVIAISHSEQTPDGVATGQFALEYQ
jgi:hypothetical protein